VVGWLSLSLGFAILYSYLGLQQAFSGDYVVQDDVRQHVYWMQRFIDPDLFPNDLITDYFQSLAPLGYAGVYRVAAVLGLEPILFSKVLPPVLDIILTIYCFYVCLQVFPVPAAGFASTILLNQSLWMGVDLASSTPRAFIYPLLLSFLYYLLRRSFWASLACIVLQGLFYPPLVLLSVGVIVLRLVQWRDGRLWLSSDRRDYVFCAVGVIVGFLILLPQVLNPFIYGPTITAAEARTWPEFLANGRSVFFVDNPVFYWLGGDSGLLHRGLAAPITLLISLFLPLLLVFPRHFPLLRQMTGDRSILPQLMVSSVFWFIAAHAVLFKLYAPNRYTQHTFRIVMAIAAAIVLLTLLDAGWRWTTTLPKTLGMRSLTAAATFTVIMGSLVFYPCFLKSFLDVHYIQADQGELYQFLKQQPSDSLTASLSLEADNISTFAARPVLVSREHSRPYDVGFYQQIRQRVRDLIRAQYSPDLAVVKAVIDQYQVDFWLLDQDSFKPEKIQENTWLNQFQPEIEQALSGLKQGTTPALARLQKRCSALKTKEINLLKASCIAKRASSQNVG
jgi:hypothetical protein